MLGTHQNTEAQTQKTALAWDTETHLFGPGNMAPRMVCLSGATPSWTTVVPRTKARDLLGDWLSDTTRILVGQNVAYDMAVVLRTFPELTSLVFQAYNQDRVTDTQVREKLLKIALGTITDGDKFISLATLAKQYGYPVDLDKDTWRLRYGDLDAVPFEEWPEGALEYSRHDALATLWVYTNQEEGEAYLRDQYRQTRAAFGLHLMTVWGITTDEWQVDRMVTYTQERLDEARDMLLGQDWVFQDKKGGWHKRTKVVKEYVKAKFPTFKKTPTGEPSLDADTVAQLGDPLLEKFALWGNATSALGHATELAPSIIHARFDSLKATGRTGCEKPNIQNRATKPGDRECFTPRPGKCFLNLDFPGLELRTVAQVLVFLGIPSKMVEVLNSPGGDPHAMVAATLLGITLEEALRRKEDPSDVVFYKARQTGKIANFGLAGGMGLGAFIGQARAQYKVVITPEEGKRIITAWHETWPEFKEYFTYVKVQTKTGQGTAKQFLSERFRGNLPFTVYANTLFQGLGADVAKAVLWAIQEACYNPALESPLYGSRMVNFIHDEFLVETALDKGLTARAKALEGLVETASAPWLPDVPIKGAKALATMHWSKLAERVVSDNLLVVWTGEGKLKCNAELHSGKPCKKPAVYVHRMDMERPRAWSELRCPNCMVGAQPGKWVKMGGQHG